MQYTSCMKGLTWERKLDSEIASYFVLLSLLQDLVFISESTGWQRSWKDLTGYLLTCYRKESHGRIYNIFWYLLWRLTWICWESGVVGWVFNSLPPSRCDSYLQFVISNLYQRYHFLWVNIASCNALVLSGNKPLPESRSTQFCVGWDTVGARDRHFRVGIIRQLTALPTFRSISIKTDPRARDEPAEAPVTGDLIPQRREEPVHQQLW